MRKISGIKKLYTANEIIEDAYIVIIGSKIEDFGMGNGPILSSGKEIPLKDFSDSDARKRDDDITINLENKLDVYPGFIDAHSHVGVFSNPQSWANDDGSEHSDPVTPHVRTLDAFNSEDFIIKDAIKAGVTSTMILPGSANIIGGLGFFTKINNDLIIDNNIVKDNAGMKVSLGENPKMIYGKKGKYPISRMGNAAIVREAFFQAKQYLEKKKRAIKEKKDYDFDMKMEALLPVLNKEIPIRCHAHRFDDIATIIRLKKEFDFDLVIEHCTDGHKISDYIKKNNIPCVIGPSLISRLKEELKDRSFKTAYELNRKGVLIAITTDSPGVPINHLPQMVGHVMKEGLSLKDAIKSITINAAKICGVHGRVGSIEKGKDADIVVYNKSPFAIEGECRLTMVNGDILYSR